MRVQKTGAVNNDILDIYQDQRSRGTNGYGGIFMAEDGTFEEYRATHEVKALMDLYMKPAKLILWHHRTPTSTGNAVDQTHPLLVRNARLKYDYFIAHNGIISNDDEVKKLHEKAGFKYRTEYKEKDYWNKWEAKWNDSETLAIEVAMYIEKLRKNLRTEGSAAFVAAQVDKKTGKIINIFYGRNHQVLTVSVDKDSVTVSSEGQEKDVEQNKLFKLALDTMKITSEPLLFKEKPVTVIAEAKTPIYSGYTQYSRHDQAFYDSHEYDPVTHLWTEKAKPAAETYAYYANDDKVEELITDANSEIETELEQYYYAIGYEYADENVESLTTRIKSLLQTLEDNIAKRRLAIEAEKANV